MGRKLKALRRTAPTRWLRNDEALLILCSIAATCSGFLAGFMLLTAHRVVLGALAIIAGIVLGLWFLNAAEEVQHV